MAHIHGMGKPSGCKLIRVDAEIDQTTLTKITIRGDFFAIPEEDFERLEQSLAGIPIDCLAQRFDALIDTLGIQTQGITGNGLAEVVQSAVRNNF